MKKVAVIGAGVYGCWIAYILSKKGYEINLFEKNNQIISESSKLNQYRIHRGYHYLKSLNTAYRCQVNYQRFTDFFSEAVYSKFKSYYGISKFHSNINSNTFEQACSLLNMPYKISSKSNIFNYNLIDKIYEVDEKIYDVQKLRIKFSNLLDNDNIRIFLDTKIDLVDKDILKTSNKENYKFDFVFNCTYSEIDQFNNISNNKLDLNYILSEIGIIEVPNLIKNIGVTIIDGPFFSFLPVNENLHTISHVTYTHLEKSNKNNFLIKRNSLNKNKSFVNLKKMILDASRFIPLLEKSLIKKSFYQIKAISNQNNRNDSRPIIVEKNENCFNIIGSKVDNVFDMTNYLERYF